jgi:hypothetical protein
VEGTVLSLLLPRVREITAAIQAKQAKGAEVGVMDRVLTVVEGATAAAEVEAAAAEKCPTHPHHSHGLAEEMTEDMVAVEMVDTGVALARRLPQLPRGDNHHPEWDCRVDRVCDLEDHAEMAWRR